MRKIDYIFVHCSAGAQSQTADDIVRYHTSGAKGCLGWSAPGYHYIVEASGRTVNTWPEERIANGVRGYNSTGLHVCYIGGVDVTRKGLPPCDNRTPAQKAAMLALLRDLRQHYPSARIVSHRDFAPKACPSFDATAEYADI